MAGLCEGGNEPAGSIKAICKYAIPFLIGLGVVIGSLIIMYLVYSCYEKIRKKGEEIEEKNEEEKAKKKVEFLRYQSFGKRQKTRNQVTLQIQRPIHEYALYSELIQDVRIRRGSVKNMRGKKILNLFLVTSNLAISSIAPFVNKKQESLAKEVKNLLNEHETETLNEGHEEEGGGEEEEEEEEEDVEEVDNEHNEKEN
ncbi:hypothetical protein ANN_10349 [Periplaneta americana]|uniref:Transmembrane protein n=1 Tax=Periplaneta americana TaxID=6978 RepID=A0ABQ8TP54_PERAM|nr:hypothetical protein ANN_10349 [Periplaneta americana]